MFYWLSKTLDVLVSPLTWALVLGVSSLHLLQRGQSKRSLRVGSAALVLLYLCSISPVVRPLYAALQENDGRPFRDDQQYDAVVVLGGFLSGDQDGRIALSESAERVLRGFELLRSGSAKFGLIVAGGSGPVVEADGIGFLLETWGIARERLVLGRTSLNTYQNARELKQMLHEKKLEKLVLVTSALHMQRALDCMRAQGFEPDVLTCDYAEPSGAGLLTQFLPRAATLARTESALRELLGRVVYRLMGYSKPKSE